MVLKAKQYVQRSMAQHSMCLHLFKAAGAWITSSSMNNSLVRTTAYVLQS